MVSLKRGARPKDTEYKRIIGDRIRRYRRQRGWTQQILADFAGLSRMSLSNHEMGKFYPSPRSLYYISDALEVSVEELLDIPSCSEQRDKYYPYLTSIDITAVAI